jgi:hypothetical protein
MIYRASFGEFTIAAAVSARKSAALLNFAGSVNLLMPHWLSKLGRWAGETASSLLGDGRGVLLRDDTRDARKGFPYV